MCFFSFPRIFRSISSLEREGFDFESLSLRERKSDFKESLCLLRVKTLGFEINLSFFYLK